MSRTLTPGQIRRTNRMQIYHYIYNHRTASAHEICRDLDLSRPTVIKQLESLLEDGLIRHNGLAEKGDQAGRKANVYSVTENLKIAAGVSVTENTVSVCLFNLYGGRLYRAEEQIKIPEQGPDENYYRKVSGLIDRTVMSSGIAKEQLLGAGIAVPCPVSPTGEKVIYADPSCFTGMKAAGFSAWLHVPCTLIRDTGAAAASEMFAAPDMDSMLYLSLGKTVGAAVVTDRRILTGRYGHGTMIEHLQINGAGRLCRCGRYGCLGTECSAESILQKDESLKDFMDKVRAENAEAGIRWDRYLARLSRALETVLLLYDTQIILGGELGELMRDKDFAVLYRNIKEQLLYPLPEDFLCRRSVLEDAVPLGAALPMIWNFLESPA